MINEKIIITRKNRRKSKKQTRRKSKKQTRRTTKR